MTDFFAQLETELRIAAERPPRRALRAWPAAAVAAAVAAAGVALALVFVSGGDDDKRRATDKPTPAPVGTVIPAGKGPIPRDTDHTVVATGTAPVAGPWQMEAYRSTRLTDEKGEELQPAGLRCLGLFFLDPPRGGGGCGEFPRTPDFSRGQHSVPSSRPVKEVLVYGRTPERADLVQIETRGNKGRAVDTFEGPRSVRGDFYLILIPPSWTKGGKVTWVDKDRPGEDLSRHSIGLLPP